MLMKRFMCSTAPTWSQVAWTHRAARLLCVVAVVLGTGVGALSSSSATPVSKRTVVGLGERVPDAGGWLTSSRFSLAALLFHGVFASAALVVCIGICLPSSSAWSSI